MTMKRVESRPMDPSLRPPKTQKLSENGLRSPNIQAHENKFTPDIEVSDLVIVMKTKKSNYSIKTGDEGVVSDVSGKKPNQSFTVDFYEKQEIGTFRREDLKISPSE